MIRSAEIVTPTAANDLGAMGDAIGTLAPPSGQNRTREVLRAAIEALQVATDDIASQAIEVVATELAEVAEWVSVRELMLSQALQIAHDQHREICRLQARVFELLDLVRCARTAR